MHLLDRLILKRYINKDYELYLLAKNMAIMLIFLCLLTAGLIIRFYINTQIIIALEMLFILIIIVISIQLIRIDKLQIAVPITLFGINIFTSLAIFSLQDYYLFEVYFITTFQMTILVIAALITYEAMYAYFMVSLGIITIGIQFIYRGLRLNRQLALSNYEDYIVAVLLLFATGFILGKVISHKNRIISKLKVNEEKYSSVVTNSKDGILIHQGGIIKFANDAVSQLTGSTVDNLINKSITDFLQSEDKKIIQTAIDLTTKKQPTPDIFEVKIKRKDGAIIDIESRRTNIIFEEKESELLFLRNITEKKRLQGIMVQSEKMMSLGGLAAGMAHEINNPLAGIMQNAQVIRNRLENNSPANIKTAEKYGLDLNAMRLFLIERKIFNQLNRINEAGTRAAEIVTNMLGFARKEHSKSSHDVRELLDKTVKMAGNEYNLKKQFDFRNINIVRKYEEDLPLVPCDPGQIQQVFFNLLKNGAEAMHDTLILQQAQQGTNSGINNEIPENPQFTLVTKKNGKMVRVEIQNNFCGIPPEVQERIFEPFYTTKPVGTGTGLGLSVSYFIIHETHNGNLSVESDGKSWVKFIIELPG